MSEFLRSNWSDILAHIAQHVWLVLISTAIAIAIALPLGILITRRKRLRGPLLGIANVMQTIPSLALFGFLIPLPFIGGIGPRTAIIALVFYALLPIIRNTVTGILGVDRNVREAAVAMGMTDRQVLFQVEVPSALMALIADFGFSAIERRFDPSARRARAGRPLRAVAWAALLIGIVLMGYSAWRGMKSRSSSSLSHGQVTVGSKDFTESNLLAEIVAQMLEAKNIQVDRDFDLAGNLTHAALTAGQIDLYPEYTGTAFAAILHHQPISDPKAVYDQVKREYAEKFNLEVSPQLGFDNTFAILVRGKDARRLNLKTISNAAAYTPQWSAGFGQDFMSRADGYAGFSHAYGLRFADPPHEMALDLTYTALASHKVDLIAGNSTDGRIAALDLVQLEDDLHYFPPYEAVFLVRKDTLMRVPTLAEVLQRLGGAITTDEMRKLNYEVDGLKRDKKTVVHEWLVKKGLVN